MTMASTEPEAILEEMMPKKKGLLSRLRRGKKKVVADLKVVEHRENETTPPKPTKEGRDMTPETQVESPSPTNNNEPDPMEEEGINDEGEEGGMKLVRFPEKDAMKGVLPIRKEIRLEKPPAAREAAFGGPPRYDWIDIETAAAVKVQSIVRRNQTMNRLERQGITTVAIRNSSRRRKARMEAHGSSGGGDIPNMFACCGVGLAFGDATEEHWTATRQHEHDQYLERKKEKAEREERLRLKFQHMAAQKRAARANDVNESFEVLE